MFFWVRHAASIKQPDVVAWISQKKRCKEIENDNKIVLINIFILEDRIPQLRTKSEIICLICNKMFQECNSQIYYVIFLFYFCKYLIIYIFIILKYIFPITEWYIRTIKNPINWTAHDAVRAQSYWFFWFRFIKFFKLLKYTMNC